MSEILVEQFKKSFALIEKRGWEKIFCCIDFHDTIIPSSYKHDDGNSKMFPHAEESLRMMSERNDVSLILWTSSFESYIQKHLDMLKNKGIHFDYFNSNPECPSTDLANFEDKLYFNVLIDDKAGFNGERDWKPLNKYFQSLKR